jgi:hypothetical protein
VHVVKEGPEEELFDEKSISWEDSHARKLFYNDLGDGTIPLDGGDVAAIYASRLDFGKYDEACSAIVWRHVAVLFAWRLIASAMTSLPLIDM